MKTPQPVMPWCATRYYNNKCVQPILNSTYVCNMLYVLREHDPQVHMMSDVLGLGLTYLIIRFNQLMKWCFFLFADVRTNFPHWYHDQWNVRFSLSSGCRKCQTSVRTTAWTSKFHWTFHAYAITLEDLIITHLRKFKY